MSSQEGGINSNATGMMYDQNPSSSTANLVHPAEPHIPIDTTSSISPDALTPETPESQHKRGNSAPSLTFTDLPLEIRSIIWRFALPEPRIFHVLVWVSAGLKMQLLNRSELGMTLAHVCFEARRVVRESGYILAFRDEDEPDDPGVWFHPRRDRLERTIWGPGDWNVGA